MFLGVPLVTPVDFSCRSRFEIQLHRPVRYLAFLPLLVSVEDEYRLIVRRLLGILTETVRKIHQSFKLL